MKKQVLTKEDIQSEILSKLNKRKPVAVYLTVFLGFSILLYILYAVLYANGVYLPPQKLTFVSPTAVMIIAPLIILALVWFLVRYYYLELIIYT